MEIEFNNGRPEAQRVAEVIHNKTDLEVSVSSTGDKGLIIRTRDLTEDEHQVILRELDAVFPGKGAVEQRFDSIGPVIGEELKAKSIQAMVLVIIGIVVYIAFVFKSLSNVLSPWAMGLAAIGAMLHDVFIPLGIFSVLGRWYGVEITAVFVAAILTVLGYSISDTVVVFDRVRENVIRYGRKEGFGPIIHSSVMQTLTRSLNTTFTTLLSLVAIFIFGGETLKFFSLAMIIGIFLGSYSSIFVASPMLYFFSRRRHK